MVSNEESSLIRVAKSTKRLLSSMNKTDNKTGRASIDAAIRFIWGKMCTLSKETNRWKKATGCSSPEQYKKRNE